MSKSKIAFIGLLLVGVASFFYFDLGQYLTLETLKANQTAFSDYYQNNPALAILIFVCIYISVTALSLPGATILTLGGGALFGLGIGLAAVSISSTIGATLAFLAARYLLKSDIQQKFGSKLKTINEGIEKEGLFYLFTMRLVPVFPFFLINLVMGLTPMRIAPFFLVSMVGMLPGTAVYVNAGTALAEIETLGDILSMKMILSFALLGVFPLAAKKAVGLIKR